MDQRGTTQEELALAIGVSQSTVSDWQRKGSVPKQTTKHFKNPSNQRI